MEFILLIVHIVIVATLIVFILLQRSNSDGFGLGSGGGSMGGLMSGASKANFMTRATSLLAFAFFAVSIALSYIASEKSEKSIVDKIVQEQDTKKVDEIQAPVGE